MAAIDSLLRLMTVRSADTLVVEAGQVPALRRAGHMSELSMPVLQDGLVAIFVNEVLQAAGLADDGEQRGATVETVYRDEDGRDFAATIEWRGDRPRMTFRPRGQKTEPERAPASSPQERPVTVRDGISAMADVDNDAATTAASAAASADHAPSAGLTLAPMPGDEAALSAWTAVFERAVYERASDIILSAGHSPRIRKNGTWQEIDGPIADDEAILALVRHAGGRRHMRDLEQRGSVDLSLEPHSELRMRVNIFRQSDGLTAALRPIRRDVPSLTQLSLPDHLYRLIDYPHGLVLVCGPTGSGKSTTLVALIEHVNRTRARHVVTLEDPIEYRYHGKRSLIHQREVGRHVDSFASGLRAALRESPDIILVGEMRDRETIAAALTAAETGHLVLATLHAGSAAVAIDRIIDVFDEHQQRQIRTQLASALRAVLTQFLLPEHTGGRLPVFEKMLVNNAIAHMIRDNKGHQLNSQILTGQQEGMVPLERILADAVVAGRITRDTARSVTLEHQSLEEMIRTVKRGI